MELVGLNLPNCEVTIIGVWIWVTGDTRPVKDKLKSAGCKWHSRRKCWYFKPYKSRKTKYSGLSLDELAFRYGSTRVRQTEDERDKAIVTA